MKNLFLLLVGGGLLLAGCKQATDNVSESAGASQNSEIAWVTEWDAAFAQAKKENKPVMVDFYATWCPPCKMMDRKTFPEPVVLEEMKNWVSVKIDVDRHQELAQQFEVRAIPTMVLLSPDQKVISRREGFIGPEDLVAFAKGGRAKTQ